MPVLCYHHLFTGNTRQNGVYFISSIQFNAQMKALADSGYHTILPDQLYAYFSKGTALPSKPIMLTFDDTRASHFSIAAPILEQYGFKAVFFVMTVPIGKPGYMTGQQIKALADHGHVIGAHTWDHPYLTRGNINWDNQLRRPKKILEKMTGKPVVYFAYPYGQWNGEVINELEASGYKAAFQLNGKTNREKPLFAIPRMLANGSWSGARLHAALKTASTALRSCDPHR
ncbi:MAG TPA: polysaccharide deacetylase family protein [Chitinophaga sp.]|uniref:polysaccharide deacetylase family protein n=1 Tax=Chitinophaga sp. TaxID=1869181 RepID=UPI002DB878DA|nr:polysaccharide deacetylase family protein [Chitinophaga sp.]HEU4556171.1 polysaccharide deacetylase family protein [Chitinophaga sp.]